MQHFYVVLSMLMLSTALSACQSGSPSSAGGLGGILSRTFGPSQESRAPARKGLDGWILEGAKPHMEEAIKRASRLKIGQKEYWFYRDHTQMIVMRGWVEPASERIPDARGVECRNMLRSATNQNETRVDRIDYCDEQGMQWVRPNGGR